MTVPLKKDSSDQKQHYDFKTKPWKQISKIQWKLNILKWNYEKIYKYH